jgi:hypothetical protein
MIRPAGAAVGAIMLVTLQACDKTGPAPGSTDIGSDPSAIASAAPNRTFQDTRPKEPPVAPAKPALTDAERDPHRLLKMNLQSVSTLLGKPQFVRREASARVWQYRTELCVLDVFLYDTVSQLEVIHYEFRSATDLSGPTNGCFEEFLLRVSETASS